MHVPWTTRLLGMSTLIVDRLAPGRAAPLAYRLWFRTARPRMHGEAERVMARAERERLATPGGDVELYTWGAGPAVLLVHGWGSRAARMADFVGPLLEGGFRVVAVDLPAHGAAPGVRTDIFHVRDALVEAGRRVGPLAGVVAHSLGALGVLAAERSGLAPSARVLVSPAYRLDTFIDTFARRTGLSSRTVEGLRLRLWRFVGDDFYDGLAPADGTPTLVIHDREDDDIPWQDGRWLADRLGGRLETTEGLGHRRILADAAVAGLASSFLATAVRPRQRAGPPFPLPPVRAHRTGITSPQRP